MGNGKNGVTALPHVERESEPDTEPRRVETARTTISSKQRNVKLANVHVSLTASADTVNVRWDNSTVNQRTTHSHGLQTVTTLAIALTTLVRRSASTQQENAPSQPRAVTTKHTLPRKIQKIHAV